MNIQIPVIKVTGAMSHATEIHEQLIHVHDESIRCVHVITV